MKVVAHWPSRYVPLTATLADALKAIKHLRGQHVFCNTDGSPLTLWQLHERLEGACRRAGLRRIRWHDCRHSFASQLTSAGVPLRQVQEYLGHSSIEQFPELTIASPGGFGDQGAPNVLELPLAFVAGLKRTGT